MKYLLILISIVLFASSIILLLRKSSDAWGRDVSVAVGLFIAGVLLMVGMRIYLILKK